MKRVTVEKNTAMSRHVITFFSRVASGRDRPTTAIMKAMAVPKGIPFATNTSTTGTMPAALAYMGMARRTLRGTAHPLSRDMYCAKKSSGTNPCMKAPMPMPISTYSSTPHNPPGVADNGRKPLGECRVVLLPLHRLPLRLGLHLLHPVTEIRLQAHTPQHDAAQAAQEDTAGHIDQRSLPPERTEEHGHGHLVDQGGGNQESQGHPQRDASLHEPDEQRDGRTGAERRDGSKERRQQVLQSVETVAHEIVPQPLNGEISIDHPHEAADEKEQQQNLDAVIDEEVDSTSP